MSATGHKTFSIRDLAEEFGVTTRTIRFYEEAGLLQPRREGQTRVYREQDRVRLKLILRGKRLGLSLAESRELIEMYDPATGNRKQLQALLDKIQQRQAMLDRQLADIKAMRTELDEAARRCVDAMNQKAR
ncbi:MerR family transcriptional regulator [Gilvimarinus sp. F26214L]|uniref:MerR family transcriptional regulator n=1 Tax=Gilvimarinus sp. DZF01 TaxID=3461371 RepID=UPI004046523F